MIMSLYVRYCERFEDTVTFHLFFLNYLLIFDVSVHTDTYNRYKYIKQIFKL